MFLLYLAFLFAQIVEANIHLMLNIFFLAVAGFGCSVCVFAHLERWVGVGVGGFVADNIEVRWSRFDF